MIPYFVFRSDNEFYLTSILWSQKLVNTMDFFAGQHSMQNLSFLINSFVLVNNFTSPIFVQMLQWFGYVVCFFILMYSLFKIAERYEIRPVVIAILFSFLIVINPQGSISASRFITDYLHPRFFSFSFFAWAFYFNLVNRKWLFGPLFALSLFSHPITAILSFAVFLPFLVYKKNLSDIIKLFFTVVFTVITYYFASKVMNQNNIVDSPFTILDEEWKEILFKTMPFIFSDYLKTNLQTYGYEALVTIFAFLYLGKKTNNRIIIIFNIYVIFVIFTLLFLQQTTNFLIFYQLQPFRIFNFINLLIVLYAGYIISQNTNKITWASICLILTFWIIYRPTESFDYQKVKLSVAAVLTICSLYIFKFERILISIILIVGLWTASFRLNWSDGKIYEVTGKSLLVQNYSEWKDLVEIKDWFLKHSSQSDTVAWTSPDERSSLLRLLIGIPTYVGKKDGGIALYSRSQAFDFSERISRSPIGIKGINYIISKEKLDETFIFKTLDSKYFIYQNQ